MIAISFFAVALVILAYMVASDYLRRSENSFTNAEMLWAKLNVALTEFVESEAPVEVKSLATKVALTTGCGCLVRGVLIGHYFPRFVVTNSARRPPVESAFSMADQLGATEKALFDSIMALSILFDSYRNPFQGWLFRRVLQTYMKPEPTYSARMEARLATVSVLSRRQMPKAA